MKPKACTCACPMCMNQNRRPQFPAPNKLANEDGQGHQEHDCPWARSR